MKDYYKLCESKGKKPVFTSKICTALGKKVGMDGDNLYKACNSFKSQAVRSLGKEKHKQYWLFKEFNCTFFFAEKDKKKIMTPDFKDEWLQQIESAEQDFPNAGAEVAGAAEVAGTAEVAGAGTDELYHCDGHDTWWFNEMKTKLEGFTPQQLEVFKAQAVQIAEQIPFNEVIDYEWTNKVEWRKPEFMYDISIPPNKFSEN